MVQPVKNTATASDRIRALEKGQKELQGFIGQLVQGINQTLNQQFGPLNQRLATLEEIVAVLVEDFGPDEVQASIDARQARRLEAEIEKAKANIADGVAKGYLVPTDAVTEKSLIVGFESDANDVPANPPWASLIFTQLREDLKPAFLGAKVGSKVVNGTGNFTVVEAYDVDEEKARVAAAEAAVVPVESGLPPTT